MKVLDRWDAHPSKRSRFLPTSAETVVLARPRSDATTQEALFQADSAVFLHLLVAPRRATPMLWPSERLDPHRHPPLPHQYGHVHAEVGVSSPAISWATYSPWSAQSPYGNSYQQQ